MRGYRGGAEMSRRIYSPLSLIAVSWLDESTLVRPVFPLRYCKERLRYVTRTAPPRKSMLKFRFMRFASALVAACFLLQPGTATPEKPAGEF